MRRTIITSLLIFIFLIGGTLVAVLYAKGYRMIPAKNGKTAVQGTGLLVLTSKPEGARVYIDDVLNTATNNTINLFPGRYTVKIEKDGYIVWQKTLEIQKEVVTEANVLLIPVAPKLESITLTGANNVTVDPVGSLIAYTVSSGSATKNGIYILDMRSNPLLPIGNTSKQLADESVDTFSKANLAFSPDSTELIATVSSTLLDRTYRLGTNANLQRPENVSTTLFLVNQQWKTQEDKLTLDRLRNLKRQVVSLSQTYFEKPIFSPEKDKILYIASQSATLPIIIKPRLKGSSTLSEVRNIETGNVYVYDIKEDRNYLIYKRADEFEILSTFIWHPDSRHLLFAKDRKIQILEFDGSNLTTIYTGPFENNFFYPWPDGSRLVILTNLGSSDTPFNLYTVSLK